MKHLDKLLSIALAGALLASCSQADEPGGQLANPAPAAFSARIGEGSSRAVGTEWFVGDAIGISGTSGSEVYKNVKYITEAADGAFSPDGPAIFYHTADPVEFTAYYPYEPSIPADGIIGAYTGDQEIRSSFDFLWARASGSYADPAVSFSFSHCMSRINVAFTAGNDVDLSGMTFSVDGLIAGGTFDMATGIAKASENASPSTVTASVDADSKSSLIVFPQDAGPLTVNATVEGRLFQCSLSLGKLEAGRSYNVAVAVKKEGMTVTGSTIASWNDGASFSGTGTMTVPPRKGDFFYSDGTYSTKLDPDKTCIGIVFFTPADANPDGKTPASLTDDKIMNARFPDCTHGLVVALKDAGFSKWFGYSGISVYLSFQNTDSFAPADKEDYRSILSGRGETDEINYILGFQNTEILRAFQKANTDENKNLLLLDCLDAFASEVPAPDNTTGWFVPSAKELILIANKDIDNVAASAETDGLNFMNEKIIQAGGEALQNDIWSSTEYNYPTPPVWHAWCLWYGQLAYDRNLLKYHLRTVLAF